MKNLFLNGACIIAKSHDGMCLSTEYKNAKSPLIWRCSKNHIWTALLRKVKYKESWCPHCIMLIVRIQCYENVIKTIFGVLRLKILNICAGMPFQVKYSINDAHRIAKSQNDVLKIMNGPLHLFKLKIMNHGAHIAQGMHVVQLKMLDKWLKAEMDIAIFDKYINNNTKLQWCCIKGHEWFASFEYFHRKPYTLKYVKQYAYNKNGKCLSEKYINCEIPLCWYYTKGYEWTARFNNITSM
ncbi:hypothetical protein Glove_120g136 [Diversispora epigaea]|uniref:Zinc-ribbon domain-containing protein n=1 Tax=Diversispora epigaea TaxID=1348612 RepID=A0A397J894_9GLOM|nr:hypothetical protein Glove_120g136 [Diversispora epigaea]